MEKRYDAIIIGGGPAGLSAAIYLARAKFSVLMIEKKTFGGQITITSEVVNYPGIEHISGSALTEGMQKQAAYFGAEFLLAEVLDVEFKHPIKKVKTSKGEFECAGIIMATGSHPRKIGFAGEAEFQGRGVAYCATCDGEFFTGKEVFVIGGGFAAAEEAIFLTKYASHVTMIVREPDFTCAPSIADQVKAHKSIDVHYHTEIIEVSGAGQLEKAVFKNNETNETWEYQSDQSFGVFVFAGYEPANSLCKDMIELSDTGNILTDERMKTNIDGVYAAGDIRVKDLRQVVTATSDGAIAATSLERYLPTVKEAYQFVTKPPVLQQKKQESHTAPQQEEGFVPSQMKEQLQQLYASLPHDVTLICHYDSTSFGKELLSFCKEFVSIHDALHLEEQPASVSRIELKADGMIKGISYYAVPGGHEFTSFVLGVYQASGAQSQLDVDILQQIKSISGSHTIQVAVSLSCTMCPSVVQAAQRIALEHDTVKAEIYDLAHFPDMKEKYNIMSVPCIIIDEKAPLFGKKDIAELISHI